MMGSDDTLRFLDLIAEVYAKCRPEKSGEVAKHCSRHAHRNGGLRALYKKVLYKYIYDARTVCDEGLRPREEFIAEFDGHDCGFSFASGVSLDGVAENGKSFYHFFFPAYRPRI